MDKALKARMEAAGYTVTETGGTAAGCCIQSSENAVTGRYVSVPAGALDEAILMAVLHVEALEAGDPTPTVEDWTEALAKGLGTSVDVQAAVDAETDSPGEISIAALRVVEGTVWESGLAAAETIAANTGSSVVDVLAKMRQKQEAAPAAAVAVPK